MNFLGKIIGAFFGYLLLMPVGLGPVGLIVGVMLGHNFDKGLANHFGTAWEGVSAQEIQSLFFEATFTVLGHIAKSDGRVTAEEIAMAEQLMARMRLSDEMRKKAIDFFNHGKSESFNLDESMVEFAQVCQTQRMLARMFLEIQLQAALADGKLASHEKAIILQLADYLNFSSSEVTVLLNMVENASKFHNHGNGSFQHDQNGVSIHEAYQLLGISPNATDNEVKRAYRKLMAQHHPDKLIAKGLPEEMMVVAKEKTQEIQNAYDLITKNRKA